MTKLLHTRLRVNDLSRSIRFYERLGFECVRRIPKSPEGNELAFLELPDNEHQIELTYTPGQSVKVPADLVHTALGFPNLASLCESLEKDGVPIWPDNWREKFKEDKMAFVTDPDGYEVELLERSPLEDLEIELPEDEDEGDDKKEEKEVKKSPVSVQNIVIIFVAALSGFAAGQVIGQYVCSPFASPVSIIKMEGKPAPMKAPLKPISQPKAATQTSAPLSSATASATPVSATSSALSMPQSSSSSADGTSF